MHVLSHGCAGCSRGGAMHARGVVSPSPGVTEVDQHRLDPPVHVTLFASSRAWRRSSSCASRQPVSEICREAAMAALLLPLAISPRISDSRGVSQDRSDFRRDDLDSISSSTICGSMMEPPRGNGADGLGQLVRAGDLLLQEVAPASRPRLEEGQRVGGRLVLAEYDDSHLGLVLAEPGSGLDPLVGPGRGHADVGDDHSGRRLLDEFQEFRQVGGPADEIEVRLTVDNARDALPEECVVLRQNHLDARHALRTVARRSTAQVTGSPSCCHPRSRSGWHPWRIPHGWRDCIPVRGHDGGGSGP